MEATMSKIFNIAAALAGLALIVTASPAGHAGPPGHAKHKSKHREDGPGRKPWKSERGYSAHKHRHGPPPWATAHGYRRKIITYRTRDRHDVRVPESDLVLRAANGFARCNRDVVGAVFGGAAGAAVGSQFGKGDGKTAATIAGAIIGTIIGGHVGRAMDQVDQSCVGQALERAETGRTVVWRNPDNGGDYKVTPTETYRSADGRYCRAYVTTVVIDGRDERAHGTACRQPDGRWEKAG
jgi:surface antigen